MATCRSCGKPIVWATTVHGKAMPVDAAPTENGNVVLTPSPVGPTAEIASAELRATAEGIGVPLYTSHFATCRFADRHRKRGRR